MEELIRQTPSPAMKPKFEKTLANKKASLANAGMTLDSLTKRLDYLNSPEAKEKYNIDQVAEGFPYGNVSRSSLSEEDSVKIIKQYGKASWLSMPI